MTPLNDLLRGALAVLCWVVGMFFLRFWRQGRDRFFLIFAAAFWVLSLNWIGLSLWRGSQEAPHPMYFLRLLAYLLIVVAVVDKNRSRPS